MTYIQRTHAMFKELRTAILHNPDLPLSDRQKIAERHGFLWGTPEDIRAQRLKLALAGEIFDPLYLGM